tara:strand:+ start:4117 stop:5349 length:1233 start_codon:yes stop_codon:yes gene_type:complete
MCFAVCPTGAIEIEAYRNGGEPIVEENDCTGCNQCMRCCPGLDDFWSTSIPSKGNDFYVRDDCFCIGPAINTYLTHSHDHQERISASSGGTVSAICRYLLDYNIVDAVVGVGFANRIQPIPQIVCDSKDLFRLRQSKYARVPNCKIMRPDLPYDSVCFIGLPCHLKAIKKTLHAFPAIYNKVKLLLGLYCGNGLYYEATLDLIKRLGCPDPDNVESIGYREGQWPGKFSVKMKNSNTESIDKIIFNYLSFFYTPKRCYLCNELPSFDADISFSDGWAMENLDSDGWNNTVARTKLGDQTLNHALKAGYLIATPIPTDHSLNMHRHGMFNKHYIANLRCGVIDRFKGKTPNYSTFKTNLIDYLIAVLTLICFYLGNKKGSRLLASWIPFSVYEKLMSFSRKKWIHLAGKRA